MKGENGRKLLKLGMWTLSILILFLAVQTLASFKEWRNVDPVQSTISVSGEGEIVIVPDVATFSFTVSADAANVSAAQTAVTDKVNAITDALKDMGVEEKDIKTTDYSVWPKYTYQSAPCTQFSCPPSRQVADGYTANHSLSVKVRKTENAGQALGVAGDNGATNISGITFTVDDPEQVREEARSMAIEDARSKAKVLAKDLGVRLVRVVSYYDNTQDGRMPYGMGGDMLMFREQAASSAPTIPQGENKVTVQVNVVYEIR